MNSHLQGFEQDHGFRSLTLKQFVVEGSLMPFSLSQREEEGGGGGEVFSPR
jgi:hypothetical protein